MLRPPALDLGHTVSILTYYEYDSHREYGQQAAEAPRLSSYSFPLTSDPHPYNPNLLKVEERMGREALEGLATKGHDVVTWPDWHPAAGSVCGILIDRDKGTLTAGADPRRVAYALAW